MDLCPRCRGATPPPGKYCRACGNSTPRTRPDLPVGIDKRAYVKSQGQTRNHTCHWPGCTRQVPPALWGCYSCWRKLPKHLRDEIWRTFEPGQEVDLSPSDEYLEVADKIQRWIKEHGHSA